jgi:hypothetical protein
VGLEAKLRQGGQCKRGKLVCGGYNSTATFIVYKPPHSTPVPAQNVTGLGRNPSPVSIATKSLDRTASQARILDDFWESFFPKCLRPTTNGSDYLDEWAYFIKTSYDAKSSAKIALLATGLAALGLRTGERRYQVAAMEAYSRALMDVNRALQDSERCKSVNVLATCKILALYEVYTPPSQLFESIH